MLNDAEGAFSRITPEIAKTGVIGFSDLLSSICSLFEEEERALVVAKEIVEKGYVQTPNAYIYYDTIIQRKFVRLLHYITNKHIHPTWSNGISSEHFTESLGSKDGAIYHHKYLALVHNTREKARNAAIALIGVAKQRKGAKAVLRVMSRVVWSERESDRWFTPHEFFY